MKANCFSMGISRTHPHSSDVTKLRYYSIRICTHPLSVLIEFLPIARYLKKENMILRYLNDPGYNACWRLPCMFINIVCEKNVHVRAISPHSVAILMFPVYIIYKKYLTNTFYIL